MKKVFLALPLSLLMVTPWVMTMNQNDFYPNDNINYNNANSSNFVKQEIQLDLLKIKKELEDIKKNNNFKLFFKPISGESCKDQENLEKIKKLDLTNFFNISNIKERLSGIKKNINKLCLGEQKDFLLLLDSAVKEYKKIVKQSFQNLQNMLGSFKWYWNQSLYVSNKEGVTYINKGFDDLKRLEKVILYLPIKKRLDLLTLFEESKEKVNNQKEKIKKNILKSFSKKVNLLQESFSGNLNQNNQNNPDDKILKLKKYIILLHNLDMVSLGDLLDDAITNLSFIITCKNSIEKDLKDIEFEKTKNSDEKYVSIENKIFQVQENICKLFNCVTLLNNIVKKIDVSPKNLFEGLLKKYNISVENVYSWLDNKNSNNKNYEFVEEKKAEKELKEEKKKEKKEVQKQQEEDECIVCKDSRKTCCENNGGVVENALICQNAFEGSSHPGFTCKACYQNLKKHNMKCPLCRGILNKNIVEFEKK